MAVNDINPVAATVVIPVAAQAQNQVAPIAAVFPELSPTQNAALAVNETLQDLAFTPTVLPDALFLEESNPVLAAILATQNLTLAQQTALLINRTIQNLNPNAAAAPNILLINEISPALTEFLANQTLTPSQQTTLLVNQALQNLTPATAALATQAAAPPAVATVTVSPNLFPTLLDASIMNVTNPSVANLLAATNMNPIPLAAIRINNANPGLALVIETANLNPIPPTVPAPPQAAPLPAAAIVLPPPLPAVAAVTVPIPTLMPEFAPNLTTNPIAVGVYEIKDPKPPPPEPKPLAKETLPLLPIGRVRPVDRLLLRRAWLRRRGLTLAETIPQPVPPVGRAIRQAIAQANEEFDANGLPLHLVLTQKETGYAMDLYDCSDPTVCRLVQNLPLGRKELPVTLANLHSETGIIIDTQT